MKGMKRKEVRYMYWVTGLLGLALMFAPYVLGYTNNTAGLWTSLAIGAMIAIASVAEAIEQGKDNIEYWIALVLGIGAIIAPFVFGFNTHVEAMWSSIVLGGLVALAAGARLIQQSDIVKIA